MVIYAESLWPAAVELSVSYAQGARCKHEHDLALMPSNSCLRALVVNHVYGRLAGKCNFKAGIANSDSVLHGLHNSPAFLAIEIRLLSDTMQAADAKAATRPAKASAHADQRTDMLASLLQLLKPVGSERRIQHVLFSIRTLMFLQPWQKAAH